MILGFSCVFLLQFLGPDGQAITKMLYLERVRKSHDEFRSFIQESSSEA